jgi:hypothetical protein
MANSTLHKAASSTFELSKVDNPAIRSRTVSHLLNVARRTDGRGNRRHCGHDSRRIVKPNEMLDERLEPAVNLARRAELRSLARVTWLDRNHDNAGIEALASHLSCQRLRFGVCYHSPLSEVRGPQSKRTVHS